MKVSHVVFLPLLLLCFATSSSTSLMIYYMPLPCTSCKQRHIYLDSVYQGSGSSGILKLDSFDPGDNCSVVLHSRFPNGITLSVEELYLGSKLNVITFTDGYKARTIDGTYLLSKQAAYSSYRPKADITVSFRAGSRFKYHGGFKMVFTAYKNGSDCSDSSFFQCDNNRCIAKDVAYDRYNHCGDSSNLNKSHNKPVNVSIIVGYVFGSFLMVIGCCLMVIMIRRKQKRTSTVQSTAVGHLPTINYLQSVSHLHSADVLNPTAYPSSSRPPPYSREEVTDIRFENPNYKF